MSGGGGGDAPPFHHSATGGEFLLSLLQRSNNNNNNNNNHHSQTLNSPAMSQFPVTPPTATSLQQQQPLALDPAVAAVGPSVPYAQPPPPPRWQANNGGDVLSTTPWPHNLSPPGVLPGLYGFPQNPFQLPANQFQGLFGDDLQRLGFSSSGNNSIHSLLQQKQQLEPKLQFGSFRSDIQTPSSGVFNSNLTKELDAVGLGIRNLNGLERNTQRISNSRNSDLHEKDQRVNAGWGNQLHGGNYKSQELRMPPPGFSNNPGGGGGGVNWDFDIRNRGLDHNVSVERGNQYQLSNKNAFFSSKDSSVKDIDGSRDFGLTRQLDRPGPPAGSNLHSVSASDMEES